MANLGIVVITPKGTYSAVVNYVKLDCVLYEGSSWLALQPSIGQTPIEGGYWTLMAQGVPTDIKDSTVTFSDATADAALTSGSKISVLIGLIKYKLTALATAVAAKVNTADKATTDTENNTNKWLAANVGYTLGQEIDTINNNLPLKYKQIWSGGTLTTSGVIALSDTLANYNALLIHTGAGTTYERTIIMYIGGFSSNPSSTASVTVNAIAGQYIFTFVDGDPTHLTLALPSGGNLRAIYGLKFNMALL